MQETAIDGEPMGEWIEVQVETWLEAGELLGMLDDPAVTGAWEENGVVRLYWPADQWNPDVLNGLKRALHRLDHAVNGAQSQVASQAVTVNRLPDQDWNERWARSVQPIRIGRRVLIRPSWESVTLQPGEIELILDPKQAFGTGHHATTRMLIEWLEEAVRGGERVLDVGTGSGILTMLAIRLGARSAVGIDHDPVAIDCAKDYAATNGFGPELELRVATLQEMDGRGSQPFDIILANLDRRTFMSSVGFFEPCLRRGARLLLSGVLVEDRAEMAELFSGVGGVVRAWRERDGWLALEIIMPDSCEGAS